MPSRVTQNKDFKDLKIALTQADKKNTAFMSELWRVITNYTLDLIRHYSPKDTGTYSKAWKVLQQSNDKLVIGLPKNPELQLIFQIKEFTGITQPFIRPKAKQALTWIDPFTNERVFAKYVTVDSPLQKEPQPHLRPAWRSLKRDMQYIVAYVMRRHFKFVERTMPQSMGKRLPKGNKSLQRSGMGRKRLYNRTRK